jgi:pimeloyl-ACP methyl ester carboxylesterase
MLAAATVTASGELYATQLGTQGPRVVFLHGLFGQGRNWTTVAKALSDSARVSLVDLPNHGRSAWTEEFSYPEMADQLAHLLSADDAEQAYAVVGHSMGGKVAMTLALRHPELVTRLCVSDVSPVARPVTGFERYVEGLRSIDLATLPDRAAADAQVAPYVPEQAIRGFLLQNLRRDHPPSGGWRWQMNLKLLGDHLAEMGDWPDLRTEPYRGPVLWLAGEHSSYVRPEHAPIMRALFPRVQLVTVKGAGHWLHSDQPAVFEAIMRRFLRLEADQPGKGEG